MENGWLHNAINNLNMKSIVEFITESRNKDNVWPDDENRQWEGEYAILYVKPGSTDEHRLNKNFNDAPEGFYKVTNKDRKETVYIYPKRVAKSMLGWNDFKELKAYELPEDFIPQNMNGKYAGVEEFMNSFINGNDEIDTLTEIKL